MRPSGAEIDQHAEHLARRPACRGRRAPPLPGDCRAQVPLQLLGGTAGQRVRREDVERLGFIPDEKMELTAGIVGRYADAARREASRRLEVLITSPGRQARNGDELVERLGGRGSPARLLDAREEARLAFVGAVGLACPPPHRRVAVVDVGGGSAQVVVGTRRDGAQWVRSIDLGSQRLTSRLLSPIPWRAAIEAAREGPALPVDIEPPSPRRRSRSAAAPGP